MFAHRFSRLPRTLLCVITVWLAGVAAARQVSAQHGTIRGTAADSLRGQALAGAFIELLPTGRQVRTDARGTFQFDTVAPGDTYRLRVMHALLDSVGLLLTTPPFPLAAAQTKQVDVAVPSAATLVALLCSQAWIARGPAALVGFVRDPDTGAPIDSVTISLVYDESPLRQVQMPVHRVARPNAAGHYALCGLPAGMDGKVQLSRNGVRSGDIPVSIDADLPLTVRGLGMSAATTVAVTADSVADALVIVVGDASMRGRVVNQSGDPIAGAHVQIAGTFAATATNPQGEFTLDSVPIGTQSIVVRKIGYGVAERPVEVSRYATAAVTVVMPAFVPMLAPVVTVSQRTRDMESTGFARRKARGLGFFLEGEQIDRGPPTLGEALRMIPGIRVGYDAGNTTQQKALIMASRDPRACLRYVVDGVYWQEVGGDIETYVRPEELEALEMYTPTTVPGEFAAASRGRCSVLVLWTRHKIRRAAK